MDRTHAAIAYQLAETTRALCDHTERPEAFTGLADVRDVAEGLLLAVCQMPLAVRQLSAGLRLLEESGSLRADDGTEAPEATSGALRALLNAEVGATLTKAALREVEGALADLLGRIADGEDVGV